MENWVCFTFFKPNVSQRLFTLPRSMPSLSHYTLHHSLRSCCLSLPHPFPSFSLTHFDQTPLPVLWSLPYPFRTLTCSVISSMLAWIDKYATLCNALFSMMWRIPQKCKQNFGGDLSTIATLMFAVLHVLLNSSSREYTEHPWKVYASILGVSCPHC